MDFFPAMGEFRQMQRVMHLLRLCVLDVFHAHNRDSSGATARVQLEGNGLDNALRMPPILETDNKRRVSMHHCSFSVKQDPCSFL